MVTRSMILTLLSGSFFLPGAHSQEVECGDKNVGDYGSILFTTEDDIFTKKYVGGDYYYYTNYSSGNWSGKKPHLIKYSATTFKEERDYEINPPKDIKCDRTNSSYVGYINKNLYLVSQHTNVDDKGGIDYYMNQVNVKGSITESQLLFHWDGDYLARYPMFYLYPFFRKTTDDGNLRLYYNYYYRNGRLLLRYRMMDDKFYLSEERVIPLCKNFRKVHLTNNGEIVILYRYDKERMKLRFYDILGRFKMEMPINSKTEHRLNNMIIWDSEDSDEIFIAGTYGTNEAIEETDDDMDTLSVDDKLESLISISEEENQSELNTKGTYLIKVNMSKQVTQEEFTPFSDQMLTAIVDKKERDLDFDEEKKLNFGIPVRRSKIVGDRLYMVLNIPGKDNTYSDRVYYDYIICSYDLKNPSENAWQKRIPHHWSREASLNGNGSYAYFYLNKLDNGIFLVYHDSKDNLNKDEFDSPEFIDEDKSLVLARINSDGKITKNLLLEEQRGENYFPGAMRTLGNNYLIPKKGKKDDEYYFCKLILNKPN